MLDRLKGYREPLAAIILLIVAVNLVIGVVKEVLRIHPDGIYDAMRGAGGLSMGLVSVLFVVLAAGFCCLQTPVTRHGRVIAMLSTLLVGLGTLIALANLIGGLLAPSTTVASVLEAVGGGTDVVLKAVATFVLAQIARRVPGKDRPGADARTQGSAPASGEVETAPTWTRDAAAGASWQSARQAAGGAAGSWGTTPGARARSGWDAPGQQASSGPGAEGQAPARPDRSLWNPPG